jgi:hypothetical protein
LIFFPIFAKLIDLLLGSSIGRAGGCSKLQLPREIVVEKSGELREAYLPNVTENGNPEPSLGGVEKAKEGAETRARARTLSKAWGKRPTPSLQSSEAGDEIVQARKKFWGSCNH